MTKAMDDWAYSSWRFDYWLAVKTMTTEEIDEAVERGEIVPGEMPKPKGASDEKKS